MNLLHSAKYMNYLVRFVRHFIIIDKCEIAQNVKINKDFASKVVIIHRLYI